MRLQNQMIAICEKYSRKNREKSEKNEWGDLADFISDDASDD